VRNHPVPGSSTIETGERYAGGPVCTLQKHQNAGSPNQNGSLAEETLERALEGL